MDNTPPVLFEIHNQVGWITLNRPKALNALSFEMVQAIRNKLDDWQHNVEIKLICLTGAGEKAFCAGGDIRALYDCKREGGDAPSLARNYLSTEYEMDYLFHSFPKPSVVYMDGIVMGGGVGISIGCRSRIVTGKTKWAMPEMNIGFFPDVGASYFLNRMPGHIGRYLALTSETITAADILYIGAADWFLPNDSWEPLRRALRTTDWNTGSVAAKLDSLINSYAVPCSSPSLLEMNQGKIDHYFSFGSVEQILSSLESRSEEDTWAAEKAAMLKEKSPTSLKVALEQLIRGKSLTLQECFRMEVELGIQFMMHHDFFEGVRALLIDKDRNPQWIPAQLEEVETNQVDSYFPLHKR